VIIQTRIFVTENTSSSPLHILLDVAGKAIEILPLPHGGDQYMTPNAALTRGPKLEGPKAMQARDIAVQWPGWRQPAAEPTGTWTR
jgi:hypothetical protein